MRRDEGNKTERQERDGSSEVIKPHTKPHDPPQGHRGEAPVGVATCVCVLKEARYVFKQEASSLLFIWLIVFFLKANAHLHSYLLRVQKITIIDRNSPGNSEQNSELILERSYKLLKAKNNLIEGIFSLEVKTFSVKSVVNSEIRPELTRSPCSWLRTD